jgi:uncharacterized protein
LTSQNILHNASYTCMVIITKQQFFHIIRFDNGDDVIDQLAYYAKEHTISSGTFTCIGAAKQVLLSFYDLKEKKYLDKSIDEDVEITSVIGNIAVMDGKIIIHAHGTFAGKDYQSIGGHIKKLIISATAEVHLSILQDSIKRKFDDKTGLNLLTSSSS